MSTRRKNDDFIEVSTPVGTRLIKPTQRWWEGEGRGHVREFITNDGKAVCATCGDRLPEQAFPTLTVPRQDGRTRGRDCRDCVKARRDAATKKRKRAEAARKAAATRAGRSLAPAAA